MRRFAHLAVLAGLLAARGAMAQEAAPEPKNADNSASPSKPAAPVGEATTERPSSVPKPPTYSPSDAGHAILPDEPRNYRWYGWQTLLADSTAIGLFGLAAANRANGPLLGASGVVYVAGGPAIHLAHGRVGALAGSLALRVGLPLVGVGLGAATASCSAQRQSEDDDAGTPCGLTGAVYGFAVGAGLAMVVDMAVLSWEPSTEPMTQEAPPPSPAVAWSLTPTMDPKSGAKGVSMVGTF
jgi:hypothetical protein